MQTFLYDFDDLRPLDRWISWLDERTGEGASFPSPEIALSVAAGMTAALTWRMPSHPDIQKWAERTLSLSKNCPNIEVRTRAYTNSAVYHIWMGAFDECGLLVGEMKKMIESEPVSPLRSIVLKHNEALFYNTSVEFQRQALADGNGGAGRGPENRGACPGLLPLHPGGGQFPERRGPRARRSISFKAGKDSAKQQPLAYRPLFLPFGLLLSLYRKISPRPFLPQEKALDLVQETGVPITEALVRLVLSQALHEAGNADEANRELAAAKRAVLQTGSSYFEYLYCLTGGVFRIRAEK